MNYDIEWSLEQIKVLYTTSDYYEQCMLFRWLFRCIHEEKIVLSGSVIESIISFEELANNLDVNLCICVLRDLLATDNLEERDIIKDENLISDAILKNIDEYDLDICFTEFFEKCTGRKSIPQNIRRRRNWYAVIANKAFKVNDNCIHLGENIIDIDSGNRTVEIDGRVFYFRWLLKEDEIEFEQMGKPEGEYFCDANKAPHADTSTGLNFFWCYNLPCFSANQSDHIFLEWEDYTLRDFIKILTINFNSDWYYRFLGLINKTNKFLPHLKCRYCNNFLRDSRTSNFAFYRVTNFHCINKECNEFNQKIYLNHCSNWQCHNVIDSRDTLQCTNEWYICDKCDVCCIHEKSASKLHKLRELGMFNPRNRKHSLLLNQVTNRLSHFTIQNNRVVRNR